ncbi:dihydroneopterin aldolase [Solitalea koreensis]|uniref:7,8-dihydroneopterin aldolase n=1 Tax=Solitalea koreensis TaxID=543615 RepID=A0A521BME1_9SPHI|nr:dihydroneopterin aldolase [Solitalea koreensis]SMO47800.1 dihydroneopterin aldolase [Solitalea koreensis]
MSYQKINKISLNGLEVFAQHGFYVEEQLIGGKFVIDIEVETDFADAAKTDQITGTVNYEHLFEIVTTEMRVPSKLLEHVAQRIIDRVIALTVKINKVSLIIKKINPPFAAKIANSSITIEYTKPGHVL